MLLKAWEGRMQAASSRCRRLAHPRSLPPAWRRQARSPLVKEPIRAGDVLFERSLPALEEL